MSKNSRHMKRKDPMKGLVVLAVLMALLVAGCFIGGSMLQQYRANLLQSQRQAVNSRNAEKKAAYDQEAAEYLAELNNASKVNKAWPTPTGSAWEVIDLTNYPLEVPGTATVSRADIMHNGLLLINEWHSRPEDFDDSGVVGVAGYVRGVDKDFPSIVENNTCKLLPQAIDALMAALKDAKAAGLEGYVLKAGSTYRSYDDQNNLFQKELEKQRTNHPTYSEEKLLERAKQNYNYPGTSEYNSGLAFNLFLYQRDNSALNNASFYETAQGRWLYEHCWEYGLVFRFPKAGYPMADTTDKSYKTGVKSSLNIYRYVGKEHAEIMHHLDLCLEEYIDYLMEHPHFAVFENGVKKYEVTRQQVGDEVAWITVDINRVSQDYTMYLDNMGGVVTVYRY